MTVSCIIMQFFSTAPAPTRTPRKMTQFSRLALDEAAVGHQAVLADRLVAVIGGDVRAALGADGPSSGKSCAALYAVEHIHARFIISVYARDVHGVVVVHVHADFPALGSRPPRPSRWNLWLSALSQRSMMPSSVLLTHYIHFQRGATLSRAYAAQEYLLCEAVLTHDEAVVGALGGARCRPPSRRRRTLRGRYITARGPCSPRGCPGIEVDVVLLDVPYVAPHGESASITPSYSPGPALWRPNGGSSCSPPRLRLMSHSLPLPMWSSSDW